MLSLFTFASLALAASATYVCKCPASERVKSSKQVGVAYNAHGLGESDKAFNLVPWGSPDAAGTCLTTIIPDGLGCGIPVATTGAGTHQFAVETRQVFNHLTITDTIPFDNGTVLLSVEIEIGVRDAIPIPVTFHGYVYMDYNDDCRIYSARAYADVPTSVLGLITANEVSVPGGGAYPLCKNLPVGGQKREAIEFNA